MIAAMRKGPFNQNDPLTSFYEIQKRNQDILIHHRQMAKKISPENHNNHRSDH